MRGSGVRVTVAAPKLHKKSVGYRRTKILLNGPLTYPHHLHKRRGVRFRRQPSRGLIRLATPFDLRRWRHSARRQPLRCPSDPTSALPPRAPWRVPQTRRVPRQPDRLPGAFDFRRRLGGARAARNRFDCARRVAALPVETMAAGHEAPDVASFSGTVV
jgi:hypothetical protein